MRQNLKGKNQKDILTKKKYILLFEHDYLTLP